MSTNNKEKENFLIIHQMDSTKAEAENIEPSAGKELLDKYWTEIKQEIDDINIVNINFSFFSLRIFSLI
jgi:hypothetical protein